MRKLLMFFGVLTFVTQAHGANNDLPQIYNDSNDPIRVNVYFRGMDNQPHVATKSIPSGQKEAWEGIEKGQISYFTLTLDKGEKEKNLQDVLQEALFVGDKTSGTVRVTIALVAHWELNKKPAAKVMLKKTNFRSKTKRPNIF